MSYEDIRILENLEGCKNKGLYQKIQYSQIKKCMDKLQIEDFIMTDIFVPNSTRIKHFFTTIINFKKIMDQVNTDLNTW